ncbi:MAG: endolytic transglycosylase MltG [Spirochaetia bacterium]|nr:endolytic transglycosylase MltG [Spirochaetia bacterium]MCF7952555.1 endolytic transglycosylase MltG [Spirochaetales bacterium]
MKKFRNIKKSLTSRTADKSTEKPKDREDWPVNKKKKPKKKKKTSFTFRDIWNFRNVWFYIFFFGLIFLGIGTGLILRNAGAGLGVVSGSDQQQAVEITVSRGQPVDVTVRKLKREGIISSRFLFKRYLISKGFDTRIQAGSYIFPQGITFREAADILTAGEVQFIDIHVFPGMTVKELYSRVSSYFTDLSLDEFLSKADKAAAERGYPFIEGLVFPGSYRFYPYSLSPVQVVSAMIDRFEEALTPYWSDLRSSPYTVNEVIIIASMVQRETANHEEMPFIAGIIYNRLEKNMPLGIDASTRYELDDWSNPLTKAQLEAETAYNTRRKKGLPPTPIGSPGHEALKAAVYPAETDYLYYLHDRNGGIHFGRTYEDHLENKNRYLSTP